MSDRDATEEPSGQRKRIAVACGRCRKRKIRCTGDSGNGQPCLNCKNAGFEPCQFLRVASQEAPMKNNSFTYNLDVSRQFQARGASMASPAPTSTASYAGAVRMSGSEAVLPCRSGSTYAYSSSSSSSSNNNKHCYPFSAWHAEYPEDENMEYSMYQQQQPYQPAQEPGYMMGYRVGAATAAPAKPPSSNSMYAEPEPNYGYHSGHATASIAHRPTGPTASAEAGGFSYQNAAAGLSNPLSNSDRLLPMPSARPLPRGGQHHAFRPESISPVYSKTSPSSNGDSSPVALSEAPASYSSFESSPMTPYPAATTMASHMARPDNEACSTATAPPSSSDATIRSPDEPLRLTGPELTYKYTDTTRRYASSYGASMAHSYLSQGQGHPAYMASGEENERKPTVAMRV